MARLLIRNGSILTMNSHREIIESGDLLIENGTIAFVGQAGAAGAIADAEIIDASGTVVMPGLINAHTHLCMTFGRTLAPECDLLSWLRIQMPLLAALDDEAVYLAELLGCVENLKNGNTTIVENIFVPRSNTFAPEEAAFRAMRDSGIRGTVARAFHARHFDPRFIETADQQDTRTEWLARGWHGSADGRLKLSIGPLLPWILDEQDYKRSRALADRLGIAMHMHVAESPEFNARIAEIFGRPIRQVDLLQEVGCLGPNVQAAAVADIVPHEIDLLAESGTSVIFDPQTRLYWGTGFPSIRPFREAGVICGLGTNGPAANCGQDLFETMKYACATAKTAMQDPTALTRHDALAMATEEGAAAIGLGGEIGMIEPGKKADIITVDFNRAHLTPVADIPAALVYAARGSDVRDVIVDGRIVIQDGVTLSVDEKTLIDRATSAMERCVERANLSHLISGKGQGQADVA